MNDLVELFIILPLRILINVCYFIQEICIEITKELAIINNKQKGE